MKRLLFISCFIFFLFIGLSYGFEYQININESLSYFGSTVRLITLNEDKVILDIRGEDNEATLGIDKPKKIGDTVLIVKSIFYSKNKTESFAIIDFCQKTSEVCNNIDDDCDGIVDEDISKKCGSNITVGICKQGVQKCINGEWGYCEDIIFAQNEICNNLDDDCDGIVDEEITRPCGNAPLIGGCKNGIQSCTNGTWNKCEGYVFPSSEKCNNLDDDCDGKIDEELIKECGFSDKGICKLGKEECEGGSWQGCKDAIYPEAEWCDEADNDCDGVIDNDCKKKGVFSRIKDWFSRIF